MRPVKTLKMAVVLLALVCATLPAVFIAVPLLAELNEQARTAAVRQMTAEAELGAERGADLMADVATGAKALAVDGDVQRATQTILFAETATAKFHRFLGTVPLVEGLTLYGVDLKPRAAQPIGGMTEELPGTLTEGAKGLLEPGGHAEARYIVANGAIFQLIAVRGLYDAPTGVLVVKIPGGKLLSMLYGKAVDKSKLSLYLDAQPVFEAPPYKELGPVLSADSVRLIDESQADSGRLRLAVVESMQAVMADVDRYTLRTARNVAVIIFLSGVAGFLLAWLTLRALATVRTYVGRLAEGEFSAAPPSVAFAELRQITTTLADMGGRIVGSIEREKQQERARLEAQLNALRTQMNPHFLFNALNSIGALAQSAPERAGAMTNRLAELYRAIVGASKSRTVPLADELKLVEHYMTLEQVRFEERLAYEAVVDPTCRHAHVPGLLLLTMAENAVKHGIARLRTGGTVRLTISRDAGNGLIKVTMRNPAAPSGARDAAPLDPSGTSTGLANTRERLDLLYGSEHHLATGQVADGHYEVTFFMSGEPL